MDDLISRAAAIEVAVRLTTFKSEDLYAISNPDCFSLTEFYTWMRHTPIPADIAQKLGIEPKEG